jgi:hypothetical protein
MERDVQFYGLACACKTMLLLGLLAGCAALTSAHNPDLKSNLPRRPARQ